MINQMTVRRTAVQFGTCMIQYSVTGYGVETTALLRYDLSRFKVVYLKRKYAAIILNICS